MKQLEVQIMGQSYLLGCPEGGEDRLKQAVERVDGAMCKIRDAGKVRARDRIAVLAALNLAFDLADKPAEIAAAVSKTGNEAPKMAATPHGLSDTHSNVATNAPSPTLTALISRLDTVLNEDGRLL